MVIKREKERMKEYIADRLQSAHERIEVKTKEIVSGIKSDYILINNHDVVLLVDNTYPKDALARFYTGARSSQLDIAFVFYKNGKMFFRNAVHGEKPGLQGQKFKQDKGLSLKNYTDEDMRKMISFRPEEIFVNQQRDWLQYYQPKSEMLEEGIVSYQFRPVEFDYSHIDSDQFQPQNRESKRLHIWKEKVFSDGELVLDKGYVKRINA